MTHWRWEQRDETALLTLHTGNRLGALTAWSHHSCPAGRRGHGAVPWADREQGEGIEGNMGSEGTMDRQLPIHSQTAGNWCGWEGKNGVDGYGMALCVCVEWKYLENRSDLQHICLVTQSVLQVQRGQWLTCSSAGSHHSRASWQQHFTVARPEVWAAAPLDLLQQLWAGTSPAPSCSAITALQGGQLFQ